MIPEKIQEKVNEILKNDNFSEEDGDKVVINQKDEGVYYAYVESKKRGSFGHMVIDENNLSFLYGGSAINPEVLLERFRSGLRSMPHQTKKTRRNVLLPVINDDAEIIDFAKKLTDLFVKLSDEEHDGEQGFSEESWREMMYNALVLLLSAKEKDTKLLAVTMVYMSPRFVKTYLKDVKDREVYDYWTNKVPEMMKREGSGKLVYTFGVRAASLIGEQEIQDLCNNE